MSAEDEFMARMRAKPDADVRHVARALGLSHRRGKRLLRELEVGRSVSRSPRPRTVAGGVLVLAALGVAFAAFSLPSVHSPLEMSTPAPRGAADVARERDLYAAVDERDRTKVDAAVQELGSPDESVRLAALRYLGSLEDAESHVPALLGVLQDRSDRVRLAAVQIVGGLHGAAVEDALVTVVISEARPVQERLLAASAIQARTASRPPLELAAALLPALGGDSLALREQIAALLRALVGRTVTPAASDPAFHEHWSRAVDEARKERGL